MRTIRRDIWSYSDDSWSTDRIEGYGVHAMDGRIGTVDAATSGVDARCIVVDTGPWVFGKKVLLPAGVIERVNDGDGEIQVALTKDQIKSAPRLNETSLDDTETRSRLGEYYGRFFTNGR